VGTVARMAEYTPDQKRAVNAAISSALRASTTKRRHPCEVTSDRLADHIGAYFDQLSPAERDAVAHVRHILETIAESGGDGA
jgi:hypothetical protein